MPWDRPSEQPTRETYVLEKMKKFGTKWERNKYQPKHLVHYICVVLYVFQHYIYIYIYMLQSDGRGISDIYVSYEERLKECGLTTLETRRLRGDQIEVFKILNGYENIDRNMFFSLKKDSRTRGHEVKLVKDQCRLDIRKHSFSQRTINEWNKLSTDCVTASSVNMFKNKVDTYLRRAGYK